MPHKIAKNKSSIFITLFLILALLTGLTAGYFSAHGITENGKFEAFSRKVFQNEVSGSTLTLHYTLAHPEKQGIRRKKASLGTVPTDMKNTYQICSQYEKKLKSFRYSRLSTKNQLTLDSMLLYYHTEKSLGDNYLLQEPLGPSLGIQAQLPVLLAEYAFYEDRDITDYLTLLTTIRPYFRSILEFEKKKSEAGFFMSDITLDRRFARTLSSLYSSGMPIVQALTVARGTIGNVYIDSQFDLVLASVRQGANLSDALDQVDGFVRKLVSSIRIGEETGQLDAMLDSIADAMDYDAREASKRMMTMLEPMLIIIMAFVVGFIIVAVMSPIIGSYGAIESSGNV